MMEKSMETLNMKEDLKTAMIDFAETGNKEAFNDVAKSVTDECADIYYANFEGMPDDLRAHISNYMLDFIFKRMVIPVIDHARLVTRNDSNNTLQRNSDLDLINELINRNGLGEAPSETKRQGVWHEVLVEAGADETIQIYFPDEALAEIKNIK